MNNAILIPIGPERAAKTLNREQTMIILRTAPKDWMDYLSGKTEKKPEPRTAYICCTKSSCERLHKNKNGWFVNEMSTIFLDGVATEQEYNGKVVAKFRLREVEKVHYDAWGEQFYTERNDFRTDVLSKSCLSYNELKDYYFKNEFRFRCYAWHISDLEIFDEPKELSEFKQAKLPNPKKIKFANWKANYYWFLGYYSREHGQMTCGEVIKAVDDIISVKKAPQSWCYVEDLERRNWNEL